MTQHPIDHEKVWAGGALLVTAGLSLLAMLHHPEINSSTATEAIIEVREEAPLNRAIHGTLIFFIIIQVWALRVFARYERNTLLDLAITLFSAGAGGFAIAAVMSGFATPELAYRFDAQPDMFRSFGRLIFSINQAFSKLGTAAWSASAMLTAIALFRGKTRAPLLAAISGLVSIVTITLLLVGGTLDVRLMTIVLVCLLVWIVAIGIRMVAKPA
ncbi:MAG: hypothetical protein AAGA22_05955 [Pseudomonadota bacterium]